MTPEDKELVLDGLKLAYETTVEVWQKNKDPKLRGIAGNLSIQIKRLDANFQPTALAASAGAAGTATGTSIRAMIKHVDTTAKKKATLRKLQNNGVHPVDQVLPTPAEAAKTKVKSDKSDLERYKGYSLNQMKKVGEQEIKMAGVEFKFWTMADLKEWDKKTLVKNFMEKLNPKPEKKTV